MLLALVLASLAVPLGLYLGPAFIEASAPTDDDVKPQLPKAQWVPASVSNMTSVTTLDESAPMPDPKVLSKRLDAALVTAGPGRFTGVVIDAMSGRVLYDDGGRQPRVPASNTKLLTAVTVLKSLGAGHRFTTQVVQGHDSGDIILVGGGDVLLSAGASDPDAVMGHAGLQTLARQTVAALERQGVRGEVTVRVDDSLFTGNPAHAIWPEGDLATGQVAPIFPMAMYSGRFAPDERYGNRPQDSALHVGNVFADALADAGAKAGIKVSAEVRRAEAAPNATELAAVKSATVGEQVQLMLETSDNYLAETLSRMAAHAQGLPASFVGSTRNIVQTITGLGVDTGSLKLEDSSGLSTENRISTALIAAVLRIMVNTEDPDLAVARAGLPVAGLSGTLSDRYQRDTRSAAGLVRAKTGTLHEVLALSGYVVTAKGRLLIFSFIGNELGTIKPANERALDRAAAVLAGCGCS
ncbi:MAG TPA: D-alanyl-D-alanine carboxypeptidase/D-alanyl-D-alanine-endopeptidase [Arthrobacter sp.]|nr:D-alanyl-D-alanine carboxypeptidase/D-alanyl-D-alanine-endopeptidase [Arthrobacter sp.]